MPAALAAAASPLAAARSNFLCRVLRFVLTVRLRAAKRSALRAALMADLVLAMTGNTFGAGQKLKRLPSSQACSARGTGSFGNQACFVIADGRGKAAQRKPNENSYYLN